MEHERDARNGISRFGRGTCWVLGLTALASVGCKRESAETSPASTVQPSSAASASSGTVNASAGAGEDFCEVTVDGATKKLPGTVSSKLWGDEVEWPVKLFCPDLDLIGYGDATTLPMKPGKYPLFRKGGAKNGVFLPTGFEPWDLEGEVNFSRFDDSGVEGTLEAKGSYGTPGSVAHKANATVRARFAWKKPATRHRPFASGYCEHTTDDGLEIRDAGGAYAVSTSHWSGPNTKAPPFPLQLNCGRFNFGANGEASDFPMKPGKYKLDPMNANGTLSLISSLGNPTGEMTITTWDLGGIKGTFDIQGPTKFSNDTAVHKVHGEFDLKCPFVANGPCLPGK